MIAWIALALAVPPLLLGLSNLRRLREPRAAGNRPVLSVLVPARNEEANIGAAARAILASRGVELELLVLDDHSTDRTAAILAAIDDPRLAVLPGPKLPPGWSGKQHACATLAARARHDLLVFVDADVRLAPDALARMAGFLREEDAALASGFPRQVLGSWSEQLVLPLMHFLLLGFLPIGRMRRSLFPALGAGCGQLFVVDRAAYLRAGGHRAIRASRHDGLALPRAFRRAGLRTDLFDATPIAHCRMYQNAAQLWEGLDKNATEGMARPIALPIWTVLLGVGQVLPLPLALAGCGAPAWLALAASIGFRLLLARRFRQPVMGALLHPAGVALLLAVQYGAMMRRLSGRPALWRGRSYPAP